MRLWHRVRVRSPRARLRGRRRCSFQSQPGEHPMRHAYAGRRRARTGRSRFGSVQAWSGGDEGAGFGEAAGDLHAGGVVIDAVFGGDFAVIKTLDVVRPEEAVAFRLGAPQQLYRQFQVHALTSRERRAGRGGVHHGAKLFFAHWLQAVGRAAAEMVGNLVSGDAIAPRPELAVGVAREFPQRKSDGL